MRFIFQCSSAFLLAPLLSCTASSPETSAEVASEKASCERYADCPEGVNRGDRWCGLNGYTIFACYRCGERLIALPVEDCPETQECSGGSCTTIAQAL